MLSSSVHATMSSALYAILVTCTTYKNAKNTFDIIMTGRSKLYDKQHKETYRRSKVYIQLVGNHCRPGIQQTTVMNFRQVKRQEQGPTIGAL